MTSLALAMLAFLATHFALSHKALRPRLVAVLGEQGFAGAYSALAMITLVAAAWAFARAPFEPLWDLGHARYWIAMVANIAGSGTTSPESGCQNGVMRGSPSPGGT